MTPLLSDARLSRQASDGDRRAFASIYKRYHQDIYRFCLSILGRPEDAQDALQNTMVKALRALPGEQREIQLRPWLYRVAHNESIDLLRRRREGQELESAPLSAGIEIAETVAMRERLERLLTDLGELPGRQRSALAMRELAGLSYEQVGEALETSAAAARQTVYEARLGLRELEAGREMGCDEVTRRLSEADGRVTRRRDLQAHLRACPNCRAFRDSIESRRRDLAALSPLPAATGASILYGLAGGQAAGGGGLGGAAAVAGAGASKAAGTSVAVKAVATVAVVAAVGATAVNRSGIVGSGSHGGGTSDTSKEIGTPAEDGSGHPVTPPPVVGAPSPHRAVNESDPGTSGHGQGARDAPPLATPQTAESNSPSASPPASEPGGEREHGGGPTGSLPAASNHGQETAAAHKANGSDNQGEDEDQGSQGNQPGHSGKRSHGAKSHSHKGSPEKVGQPEHGSQGHGKEKTSPAPEESEAGTHPTQAQSKSQAGGDEDDQGSGEADESKASS